MIFSKYKILFLKRNLNSKLILLFIFILFNFPLAFKVLAEKKNIIIYENSVKWKKLKEIKSNAIESIIWSPYDDEKPYFEKIC